MWTYLKSAKTTILGVLVVLCGGITFSGTLEAYNSVLMLVCAMLTGAGLMASKDANVSNAPNPVAPVVVPPERLDVPNPVKGSIT